MQNFPGYTSIESEYTTQENLPNDGSGNRITNSDLLNSEVYVRVKKLGIGKTLGENLFTGGEREMLQRIEITGFEIGTDGKTVKTKFKINKISTSNTGAISADSIRQSMFTDAFRSGVLTHTIASLAAEPATSWTTDSVFSGWG